MSDEKLEYLINTYANSILRLSFSYLKNLQDAEDVCQIVLIKLYQLNKSFNDTSHEKSYILHITANVCKDMLRSSWKKKRVHLESLGEFVAPINDHHQINEEIQQLDKKYRTVIYLYYYEGYKIAEIAKILNISVSNVKIRLSRGKEKLKDMLEENK